MDTSKMSEMRRSQILDAISRRYDDDDSSDEEGEDYD